VWTTTAHGKYKTICKLCMDTYLVSNQQGKGTTTTTTQKLQIVM
jgi:hypothetical protein